MPIPQTIRVNPLDLRKNIAIGVSLPFKGPFKSTFTTAVQIKSNLINLLLTAKGERVLNPEFGADLPRLLFEPSTEDLYDKIRDQIFSNTSIYIPEITLINIDVTSEPDRYSIYLKIDYKLNISGQKDNIIIELHKTNNEPEKIHFIVNRYSGYDYSEAISADELYEKIFN
jgi:phage baseplate assembly protein W